MVELPQAPHGTQDTFYACGTVHVRTLLDNNRDVVSPVFGAITCTWDVNQYRWRPRAVNLPASIALATAALSDATTALLYYGDAIGEGRMADAAQHVESLTLALARTLHHVRTPVPLPVDRRPLPDLAKYDDLLPSRRRPEPRD